jgi:DNA-binding transcriptional ArsR family regulator
MEITQRQAELCNSLADHRRILILYALIERPHNVKELAERIGMTQPTVSRHLKSLRESFVVMPQRRGKAVFYGVADCRIMQALDLLRSVLIDRLKSEGQIASEASDRPAI